MTKLWTAGRSIDSCAQLAENRGRRLQGAQLSVHNYPSSPTAVLHLRPLFAKPLLAVMLVVVGTLVVLFGVSWSRVVTIQCRVAEGARGACQVVEETLFHHEQRVVEVPWPFEASVGPRSGRHLDAVTARGSSGGATAPPVRITRPHTGDDAGQVAVAATLSLSPREIDTGIRVTMGGGTKRLSVPGPTAKVSFGHRWRWVGVPIAAALVGVVVAAASSRRVTLHLDRRTDRLLVERRQLPLAVARRTLTASQIVGFRATGFGRTRVVALLADGAEVPCFMALGSAQEGARAGPERKAAARRPRAELTSRVTGRRASG